MTSWVPAFSTSGKPRYLEIADAIERDASSGVLTAGAQLPPQRRLADVLGLDFTTVSRAYTEAQSRGLVESHVGRGTFVRARPGATGPVADPRRAREQDLAMNLPPEPDDPALLAAMRQGLETVGANLVALLRYQSTVGSEMDRSAALSWLSMRGMVPNLDRIAVTPGAHATMAAVLQTLAAPGDTILCEAITYPGIRAIAARAGLVLIGLPMDAEGILPDALADAIQRNKPKALYLNPTLHNPTTLTIPAARRMDIAETLQRHRLPLIEDDAYGFVHPHAPAPFATLVPELTWHITGLAKCIGAGLRLAFTIAPDSRAAFQLAQNLRVANVMASPLAMALVTRWIEDGTADRICRFIRAESAARQDIAARLLQGFEFTSDRHAFNLWLTVPAGIGRAEIMGRMNGRGIGLMPSDAFTVSGAPDEHLRICLGGSITREGLRSGLSFLGSSLNEDTWIG